MRWNPLHPSPAPPGFGKGKVLPDRNSSWLSRLTIHWLGAFLNVGFSRPLMEDDFWELPASRHTDALADNIERNFYLRCSEEKRPFHLRSKDSDDTKSSQAGHPSVDTERELYDESLFKAILNTFKKRIFWSSVLLLVSDTIRTMTPLVIKVFLTWLIDVYVYDGLLSSNPALAGAAGFEKPRGLGFGVGLAFIIFGMQVGASLMANHFNLAAMSTGLYVRTGLVGSIFRKSLRLSGKSRIEHTVGQVTTMISVDVTRLDGFAAFGPLLWSAPIQLILSIGLLIGNLGYSTLAGFAVMIIALPFQYLLVKVILKQHKKGVKITDKRVRLTTEVLHGIRLIKVYGWESFYAEAIAKFRQGEIKTVKKSSIAAALLVSLFTVVPVVAIILSFVTYSLTGHDLNIAVIFTSLMLFNNVRLPLIVFPMVLSSLADAIVSLARITKFFLAEEIAHMPTIDSSNEMAISLDGDFEWEVVPGMEVPETKQKEDDRGKEFKLLMEERKKKKEEEKRLKKEKETTTDGVRLKFWKARKQHEHVLPVAIEPAGMSEEGPTSPDAEEKPFDLKDLRLEIQKGSFVAIVGRVGSGKSSILQALIGEMKRVRGEVVFGGTVAYVPQVPWIKNATIVDNILFGKPYDEERFLQVIRACSLEQDLAILPQGKHTEIGEKGITLSGGQKARVSLARAVYSQADVVLLDDPLSAVDAYVGKSIMENCLLNGPLATRTRVLVTHMLHVLDRTDYIYVMDNGRIIEQGSFADLMSNSDVFRHLIEEHFDRNFQKSIVADQLPVGGIDQPGTKDRSNTENTALMEAEERNVGAVSWNVYLDYLHNAGGLFWAPVILSLLLVDEAGNVAVTLFLGFWTEESIPHFKNGDYMAVYAGIGGGLALASFMQTYAMIILSLTASLNLFKGALAGVINSPVSFFDTTPIGRISSRLTKDQSAIDNQLPITVMQFLATFFQVFGTIALVFYTFPYLGIIFFPLLILYYGSSVFYRRSSVETKRLDSILRSFLYSSYSETLTGLPTIRAYSKQESSIQNADHGLDMENRAYFMTVAMQRWLAIRLDFFGNILVLGIALFGAATSKTMNPAKTGVVLSYTLGITMTFAEIVSLFAKCEQEMNAVERVLHYADIPREDGRTILNEKQPLPTWPDKGSIRFTNVRMYYREGLPLVLKGVNISIQPGEKIGIVGRTGSGKSSLIQALLRLVELEEGKIEVDDYDISHVELSILRNRIAYVPQDTTLFLGTLRDNLDPQRLRTDAELISVLQRAWLVSKDSTTAKSSNETKFHLDALVGDEGSNYSAGEKQLLALGRALVKDSRIIILDEATSSVDVETDAKVQQTIRTEFRSSTLLCIAHRLNTIAHYDRILVMDDGQVAEFDTVLNLYDKPNSIFRSLCEEASLTRAEILRLRADQR